MDTIRRRPGRTPLRCRTGWNHHWLRARNPDGGVYLLCQDCGKEQDPPGLRSKVAGG